MCQDRNKHGLALENSNFEHHTKSRNQIHIFIPYQVKDFVKAPVGLA